MEFSHPQRCLRSDKFCLLLYESNLWDEKYDDFADSTRLQNDPSDEKDANEGFSTASVKGCDNVVLLGASKYFLLVLARENGFIDSDGETLGGRRRRCCCNGRHCHEVSGVSESPAVRSDGDVSVHR